MAETDLAVLLRTMEPVVHPKAYGTAVRDGVLPFAPFAMVAGAEGLTAAFAAALGGVGISCNVIAGFHHDHPLVPWERRKDAPAALRALSRA